MTISVQNDDANSNDHRSVDEQQAISVLLIDDDEDDYLLTRDLFYDFEGGADYDLEWASTYDEGLDTLLEGSHDICLLDYRLGARDGVELMRQAHREGCKVPIVILTGTGDRAVDRSAMRHGAVDYLVKSEISATLLERSIRYSLERHRLVERHRTLAEENERLYHQAQRAVEMRDEMHRIVAHDLKNPLNTIGLALQLMERHVETDADAEKFAEQLQTQRLCISQMKRLIQDLLDAARIEDGRLNLSRSAISPSQIVEAAVDQHQIQAADEEIELTADLPDDLPYVDADFRRVEQVMTNLISNALKFTPRGGTIELSAQFDEDDNAVRFSVRDTGYGIPKDKLSHLFDRFWQADDESDRGTGLGLAICKGIVDTHGGHIWAESTEGEGSTFYFTIPVISD